MDTTKDGVATAGDGVAGGSGLRKARRDPSATGRRARRDRSDTRGRGRRDPSATRLRIVEAAATLHEEVGPAHTTVMAVAERAGVQRLTVYRHFPDEAALLEGCSGHWRESHPLPDPSSWSGLVDPGVRLETALRAIYSYFRGGAPMLRSTLRDEPRVPALVPIMSGWHGWMREQVGVLSAGWGGDGDGTRRVRALVTVALGFHTWEALSEAGLDDAAAADLMATAVRSTFGGV